jgi:hypothetical protein
MARASTKGKARRNRRANVYKTLNLSVVDRSKPVVLESCVPHRVDIPESFLIEGKPDAAEKYFQCKHDLVEALKRAKRITKYLVKLGPTLATSEQENLHAIRLETVFNLLDKAEDYATVGLDEIFVLKSDRQ